MNEVILYIKVANGIVEEVFGSYDELEEKDGYIKVPHLNINISDPITWYDKKWNRIEFEERVAKGIETIPKGMKINDARDGFMKKEQLEKWIDGDEELPDTMKFNADKTNVESKTQKELFNDGIITVEDYSDYIKGERDKLLQGMDKYTPQYLQGVITETQFEKVKAHCTYLRDLPDSEGFPETFTDFETFKL